FQGEPHQRATIAAGEQFVIGQTMFHVVEARMDSTPLKSRPLEELTFTRQQLEHVTFGDADRRIEVLSRLPEVIANARDPRERDDRLAGLILAGVRGADGVAVVELSESGKVRLGAWERRLETAGAFQHSQRLVQDALLRGHGTVLHAWGSSDDNISDYTQIAEVDWAFCTPLAPLGKSRLGLYVTGRIGSPTGQFAAGGRQSQLQADIKFVELVAEFVGSAVQLGKLEGNVAVLRQFLSPPLVSALERASADGELDPSLLEPRECPVTVLFCDLRGFSQRAEEAAHDLSGLLERVSAALAVMTRHITDCGGVTGDFLGDATLGFWGWPFASEESPLNACRAALAIRREFVALQADKSHPLCDFEIGIGIANGRAMAGKIGTRERMTLTVFGPVVNLASRLEGLTRQLHVPILLDEATADIVRDRLAASEGRTRRLAQILPYGMERPLMVSELLPSDDEFPDLTSTHLQRYEEGLAAFVRGDWEDAYRCLHDMPSSDRAQDFLMLRMTQSNRTAPTGWDGIVRMPGK
ncbi:MAG: adenylate/guanylate cyclase domain-containing protein, partial [Planctomycetaceae bacterium]|nr:adenylate/guanylate cyclase domain-containing protein [Planctomycetaceae bacterium]